MSFALRTIDSSEYTDHPIFLHILNRELHDAIGKPMDVNEILGAIQVFSVVSAQKIFCNVSQIHEVLYNRSDALEEIFELSRIERFIDHSDYGSYQELRESRAEKFSHSAHLHPGFFLEPRPELKKLIHGSMGDEVSTTGHIEKNLNLWLEGEPSNALGHTLSQNDARVLRANEEWIERTLRQRDVEALTFDVFRQSALGEVGQRAEGAIRRSLTELYIDSYVNSFDARCIWGFRGKNHFERTLLLAGLHLQFSNMVLEQVGITENLRKTKGFGRHKRITTDESDEAAHFRQGYAEFATKVDALFKDPHSWHSCNAVITAVVHQARSSGILRPQHTSYSYKDLLMRGGDVLTNAAKTSDIARPAPVKRTYAFSVPKETPKTELRTQLNIQGLVSPHTNAKVSQQDQPWWQNHVVLVVLGGLLIGVAGYIAWPMFFEWSKAIRFFVSILTSIIGGALIFWFHPDNYYRRMALVGLVIATGGGLSYHLEFRGWINQATGNLEVGNLPSNLLIVGGLLFSGLNIVIDAMTRWKREEKNN